MKITKRQLRRIIKEEKLKLIREQRPGQDPYMGKYQGADSKLESALYLLQEMFVEMNGVHDMEAAEMVMDECSRILGAVR